MGCQWGYYIPFIQDYKYPSSIEEEIKTMNVALYNQNINENCKKDFYLDLLDEKMYKEVEKKLNEAKKNKTGQDNTVAPIENPYITNFKQFVQSDKIITLLKLKSIPQ